MHNISITTLLVSSFVHSPFLSTNANYTITTCHFSTFFPVIFHQIHNLHIEKSYFSHTLSNILSISNPILKENCDTLVPIDRELIIQGCEFHYIFGLGTISNAIKIDISSCLFDKIKETLIDYTFPFDFGSSTMSAQMNRNCISNYRSDSDSKLLRIANSYPPSLSFIFDLNMLYLCHDTTKLWNKDSPTTGLILSEVPSISIKSCNFTSNFSPSPMIYNQPFPPEQKVEITSTQFNNNTVGALFASYLIQNNFFLMEQNCKLSNVYMYRNTITSFEGPSEMFYGNPTFGIFYIVAPVLTFENCDFDEFFYSNRDLSIFAQFNDKKCQSSTNSMFVFQNNYFGRKINDINFGNSAITYYTSVNQAIITNNYFTSTPLVMKSIDYDENIHTNWNQYCPMHHTATAIFTKSDAFTKSYDFTKSGEFTKSSTFTQSKSFTPSPHFTPPQSSFYIRPTNSHIPSPTISINVAYAACGAIGTAIVSFGVAGLIYLAIRKSCIYDPTNYFHIDI